MTTLISRAQLAALIYQQGIPPVSPFSAVVNTIGVVGVPSSYAMQVGFTGTITGQQWYKNSGSGPTLIGGATSATYSPVVGDVGAWLSVRGTSTAGTFSSQEFPAMNTVLGNAIVGTAYTKHHIGNQSSGYTALQPMRLRTALAAGGTITDYSNAAFYLDTTVGPGTFVGSTFGDLSAHAGTPTLSIRALLAPPATLAAQTLPAATATRPGYNTGTGFFVKGGAVYDSNGNLFTMRGVNQLHYDGGDAGMLKCGANAIRAFINQTVPWTTGSFPNNTLMSSKTAAHICPIPAGQSSYVGITATFAGNIMTVTAISFGYLAVGQSIYGMGTATYSNPYILVAFGTGTGGTGTYYINASVTVVTPTTYPVMGTRTTGSPYPGILLAVAQVYADQAANWTTYNNKAMLNIGNEWGPVSSITATVSAIAGTTITVTAVSSGSFSIHRETKLQLPDASIVKIIPWGGAINTGSGTGGPGTYTIDVNPGYAGGFPFTARDCTWRETNKTAITLLRGAGYTMPLMIDAPGSGQNIATLVQDGQALHDFDPQHNIVLSDHIYGSGKPGQIDSLLSGMPAITGSAGAFLGPAFVLGEFGPGRDVNASGGDPTFVTPLEIIASAERLGYGWFAWAWDDNDLGSGTSDDNGYAMVFNNANGYGGTPPNPADLTTYGVQVVLDPHYGTKYAVAATSL